jgi:hypothetical protein
MAASDGRPVHLYAICWNDAAMLPHFFRHYDPWIDRYTFYDDGSTDDTLALLSVHPRAAVRRFLRRFPETFVGSANIYQRTMWWESRGQNAWTVVTAIDEHLWHPDMAAYLASCRADGVTAIPALGFQMISETFPAPGELLSETRRMGAPYAMMNKLSIFDPDAIEKTNYISGRHVAAPVGRVVYPKADEVLNLHYKYLDRDRVEVRHKLLETGLGSYDRSQQVGRHYSWSRKELDDDWDAFAARAVDYRDAPLGWATHPERWWRVHPGGRNEPTG